MPLGLEWPLVGSPRVSPALDYRTARLTLIRVFMLLGAGSRPIKLNFFLRCVRVIGGGFRSHVDKKKPRKGAL